MELIFADISMMSVVAVALLAIVGAIIQTVCGFGFGVFVMILLPYFMPSYSSAIALSGVLGFTMTLMIAIKQRKNIQFKGMLVPLISYLSVSTIAVQFSMSGAEGTLKAMLGVVLFCLSIYFMKFAGNIHIKPSVKSGVGAGMLAGFLSGMFGMGGPPMVLYFLSATPNAAIYLATSQFFFSTTNGYNTALRAINGAYTPFVVAMWVICLISLYIGNKIGAKLISKVNEASLRKIIYAYMGISGILITVTSLFG